MANSPSPDRLTVIAIAVIAYAGVNISHEIVGHCSIAALLGTKCKVLSTTYIPLITQPPTWKYNIIVIAGSTANWIMALVCLGLLRRWKAAPSGLRYFLWLSMCVNFFLPATYLMTAPIIKFGDSYILVSNLPGQLIWRIVLALVGATICWLSFRLCRKELGRLIGHGGRAARPIAWSLVAPAYVAGGIVTVLAGLFSQLPAKWAQLQAAGGTFGLTIWLLFLPLGILEEPEGENRFVLTRSVRWIIAGAITSVIFIGVLGPGISL